MTVSKDSSNWFSETDYAQWKRHPCTKALFAGCSREAQHVESFKSKLDIFSDTYQLRALQLSSFKDMLEVILNTDYEGLLADAEEENSNDF